MNMMELIFGVIILVLLGGSIIFILNYEYTFANEQITIKEKWIKYQDGSAKYLIASKDNEVYEITDSLIMNR